MKENCDIKGKCVCQVFPQAGIPTQSWPLLWAEGDGIMRSRSPTLLEVALNKLKWDYYCQSRKPQVVKE